MDREYKIEIDPRILELLGPNLYTNIYYVLAELIANAYDADAHNVYIIANDKEIRVEDDGHGMSYSHGEIKNYLSVAKVSRTGKTDSVTPQGRIRMGRKGIGKLAALSVSSDVLSPVDKERIASSDKVRASTYLKYKDCLACFISALSVSAPRTMRLRTFAPH